MFVEHDWICPKYDGISPKYDQNLPKYDWILFLFQLNGSCTTRSLCLVWPREWFVDLDIPEGEAGWGGQQNKSTDKVL